MRTHRCRNAFTLIEVLIVVVIMAVLAATIIPQFSSSTRDAKESSLKFNMHTLRSQIELYKVHHMGSYPTITNNDLPQLTNATNTAGETGAAGPNYPYGPYVDDELPANPFDGSNKVTAVAVPGDKPAAVVGTLGGWQYDVSNGAIWPNNPEYYSP
jgi:general secretion pathway protein G